MRALTLFMYIILCILYVIKIIHEYIATRVAFAYSEL